jgi:hypothetical protein
VFHTFLLLFFLRRDNDKEDREMKNATANRKPASRATSNTPRLGTARDVALAANIGVHSIPKLIDEGLPTVVLSPNRKRFDVSDCVAWLKEKYGTGGGVQ